MIALKFLGRHWGKIILLLLAFYIFGPIDEIEESLGLTSSRMAMTLKWARLAPFPKDIKDYTIRRSQGIFHLSYTGSFSAQPEIINDWLKQSPGVREGLAEPGTNTTYDLQTLFEGLQGEIVVSPDHTHVSFSVGKYMDSKPRPHRIAPSTNSH